MAVRVSRCSHPVNCNAVSASADTITSLAAGRRNFTPFTASPAPAGRPQPKTVWLASHGMPKTAFHRPPTSPVSVPCSSLSDSAVSTSAQGINQVEDHVETEAVARAGWDPEGLLPPLTAVGTTDHFSRKRRSTPPAAPAAAIAPVEQAQGTANISTQQGQQGKMQQLAHSHTSATDILRSSNAQGTHDSSSSSSSSNSDPTQPSQLLQQQLLNTASTSVNNTPAQQVNNGHASTVGAVNDVLTPQWDDALQPVSAAQHSADESAAAKQALMTKLKTKFMPINLDTVGLKVLHVDPVVVTVDNFMSNEQCQELIQHIETTGLLQASKIGAGNAAAVSGSVEYNARRTSNSMLVTSSVQAQHPALKSIFEDIHHQAWQLLDAGNGRGWGRAGRMPAAGQYCFECPQVARYHTGQHFLSHQDAFPLPLARSNGFQRHATLLVYLNDVFEGGATRFDHLNVAVRPKRGMALLFFPAYSDGRPDERTLHTAMDAQDTKWIMQQWIARGPVASTTLMQSPQQEQTKPFKPSVEVFKVPAAAVVTPPSPNEPSKGKQKSGRKQTARKGFGK
eukprot:jgi/Chrzof1/4535/Cz14g17110.t1